MMSDEHHGEIESTCNFSSSNSISTACIAVLDKADADRGNVFFYDIYASLCISSSSNSPSVYFRIRIFNEFFSLCEI